MTLFECIRSLQTIAGTNPYINSAGDGSIYDYLNANPSVKYGVFFVSQTSHRENDYFDWYGFNLFTIDRLIDDLEGNRLQVQSIAKEVLSNTIRTFCTKYLGITHNEIKYVPFTQRFTDLCAGTYATVEFKIPKSIVCEEDFKELAIYTGNCKECYDEGYAQGLSATFEEGFESGQTYQKSLMIATQFTENGTYARENGYHTVTVNVDVNKYYNSGYTSGVTDQKNKLTSISITQNGTYTREDGFSTVTVSVSQTGYTQEDIDNAYDSGYTSGTTNQKNKLISTAVTQNGVYSREDGYNSITVNVPQTGSTINNQDKSINISANTSTTITYDNGYTGLGNVSITVNVPQTGYTQQDLDDAYNRGYTDGLNDCGSYENDYLTIEALSGGTLEWNVSGTYYKTIEYSKNGGEWISATSSTILTTVNAGDLVRIRGNNASYCDTSNRNHFVTNFNFNVYGNIMSMIYGDNFRNQTTLTEQHALCSIFLNCSYLISAENLVLPATTLSNNCYESMFSGCNNLIKAPKLPATTLANACYFEMFFGCTSLTTAPALPATTLATNCYNTMFYNCTSLTTAPELPATTLSNNCYESMFQGCTSLTTAPELPATIITEQSYRNMFQGCSNLNYIKCLATDKTAFWSTNNWVDGVASTGTFIKNASMTSWSSGSSGIPVGWEIQNN